MSVRHGFYYDGVQTETQLLPQFALITPSLIPTSKPWSVCTSTRMRMLREILREYTSDGYSTHTLSTGRICIDTHHILTSPFIMRSHIHTTIWESWEDHICHTLILDSINRFEYIGVTRNQVLSYFSSKSPSTTPLTDHRGIEKEWRARLYYGIKYFIQK